MTTEQELASPPSTLRELDDRESIRQLVTLYFVAQDNRDRAAVLNLFSDDAKLSMHGERVADGIDQITAYFGSGAAIKNLGIDARQIVSTFHTMGTHWVDLAGDNASGCTYAVAYISLDRDGQEEIMVRGLRYLDEFRRTSAGWKIVDRIHTSDWAFTSPRLEATPYAQRVVR